MANFGDISSELARWYAHRLKGIWLTSVNEGLGFFLVYTTLILTAALEAYFCLTLRTADEQRLDQFLQSDHQVRDDDRYVSALSVVLSSLRPAHSIGQGTCPDHSNECSRAREVINTTVKMAELIANDAMKTQEPSSTPMGGAAVAAGPQPTRVEEIANILSANHLPVPAAATGRIAVAVNTGISFLRDFDQRGQTLTLSPALPRDISTSASSTDKPSEAPNVQLTRCEPGPTNEEDRRRLQFALFEPLCERTDSASRLQLPEQIGGLESSSQAHTQLLDRLNWAIGISFALEAALQASSMQPPIDDPCHDNPINVPQCNQDPESRNFVAAYFVSADSIMRYWRGDRTIFTVNNLPKDLHWAEREYFRTFERGTTSIGEEYASQPYLDITGVGIVQTICRAVIIPMTDSQDHPIPSDLRQMRVPGVVCADLALRSPAVQSMVADIQAGPFVAAGLVSIPPIGEATIQTTRDVASVPYLKELTDSPQWATTFSNGWMSGPASKAPSRVKDGARVWYVIPVARSGEGLLAVALHPAPASGVGRLYRWALLGATCGAALILLTFTAHQSRRLAIASRDLARLRGLPAAVIEVRLDPAETDDYANSIIVAGNDRAEEVLQKPLPNFGLSDGAKPAMSEIFFQDELVLAEPDGLTPQEVWITARQLGEYRKRGDTSTYFARLKVPLRIWLFPIRKQPAMPQDYSWVRIAGGPVMLPRRLGWHARGRLESAVAILAPIFDGAQTQRLDSIIAKSATSNLTQGS